MDIRIFLDGYPDISGWISGYFPIQPAIKSADIEGGIIKSAPNTKMEVSIKGIWCKYLPVIALRTKFKSSP